MAEVSNWHFEIELTLKLQNRYTKAIFSNYLRLLTQKNAQLVYVTPSNIIYNSLDIFKEYFMLKKQDEELKSIDASAFDRLVLYRVKNSMEY